jgi:hypothetical protein
MRFWYSKKVPGTQAFQDGQSAAILPAGNSAYRAESSTERFATNPFYASDFESCFLRILRELRGMRQTF